MADQDASVVDTAVFESALVTVGVFDAQPDHPHFAELGRIVTHSFVFPRTSVSIIHPGAAPIVADPNAVMFYNQQQPYRRAPISPRGDRCDWFRIREDALVGIIAERDPSVVERPHTPFPFSWGPADADVYLTQRRVVEHLARIEAPDVLFVEETVLEIFRRTFARAHSTLMGAAAPRLGARARRARRELATEARRVLGTSFAEHLTLGALADRLETSPHHLARVFRAETGGTIHAHLNQLRLRASLDRVVEEDADLTAVALDLGYSSHSHFTHAFRRAFGLPPSHLRAHLSRRALAVSKRPTRRARS